MKNNIRLRFKNYNSN